MIQLYDRDAREVAEVLRLVAAIFEAPMGERLAEALEELTRWAGDTEHSRGEAAMRLKAIALEIGTQAPQAAKESS